ncbi:MAG: hypothetical protein ACTSU4_09560 [Promethearchaeota archaeon]
MTFQENAQEYNSRRDSCHEWKGMTHIIPFLDLKKENLNLLKSEQQRLEKTLNLRRNPLFLENHEFHQDLNHANIINDKLLNPIDALLELEKVPELKVKYHIHGKIHGTVAGLFSHDIKYKQALKAAAGDKLNHIIVDDLRVAQECLNFLKKNRLNRCYFLPLKDLKTYPLDMVIKANGKILGKAMDLIEFDPLYLKAFEFVYGRVIIVEEIKTAINFKINATRVTLKGEIVEPSNVISGGYLFDP